MAADTPEFAEIKQRFDATMSHASIKSIKRIQNMEQWSEYQG